MPRSGVRSVALVSVFIASGCVIGSDPLEDGGCARPSLLSAGVTSSSRNVLSALVSLDVKGADSVVAEFGAGTALDNATPAFIPASDSSAMVVPLLGLLPETEYRARVSAFNECGVTTGTTMSFVTLELPQDLPSYKASGASEGYIAFAAGNYGIVIDNTARVVWYHRFTNGPGLSFQPQPDGRFTARPNPEPGKQASWIEIDPLGDTTRTFTCAREFQPRLHDMIVLPDGSYWLLCDEIRTVDLSAQGRSSQQLVMGTGVQHRSADGDVLFEWSPFNNLDIDLSILDPVDASAVPINWTHGNSIDLDATGNVVISFRNLSEVINVDTQTGQVRWRLGGKSSRFAFENSSAPAFVRQHGVRALPGNQLLLLDNLGEKNGSRGERYQLDLSQNVARMTGTFSSSRSFVAQIGGSTQSLPSSRTLVSFGNGGGVEEYDAAGNVVWRLEGNPGYIFRAMRIKSLYRPGVGDSR